MRHRFFYTLTELNTRLEFRAQGKRRDEIGDLMDGFNQDLVDLAAAKAEAKTGASVDAALSAAPAAGIPAVGTLGDGHILAAIEAFFQSDLGKMVLQILMTLLAGLVVA